MQVIEEIQLDPVAGIIGDRYQGRSGKRQVTLLQAEYLPVIASCLQIAEVCPTSLRRNVLVRGINLLALKKQQIRIGDVLLEITGECHPCSYMEEALGPGGYNAMRGHGGMTARVLSSGSIRIGDTLRLEAN